MIRALGAGAVIGMAAGAFVSAPDKVTGAALFSAGLLSVIVMRLKLYTGRVGYAKLDCKWWVQLCGVLLLNIVGAIIIGLVFSASHQAAAVSILSAKLSKTAFQVWMDSIVCGMFMFMAVHSYRPYIVVLAVMSFILSGGEHCIANMAFIAIANPTHLTNYGTWMLQCIAGNAIGAIGLRQITDED